jgi:CRP/FNR family transcriptional regulator, anaerobic regulatory protein
MTSFEILRAWMRRRGGELNDEQFAFLKTLFVPGTLRKGSFLQRAGEEPRYGAFVARGCLRSYVIDEKGKEHVVQFAPENWWVGDLSVLARGGISMYFIDAIEDSEVLLNDREGHRMMLERIPGAAAGFQRSLQRQAVEKDRRLISSHSASAEERYLAFLKKYPSIALRVPQHMIASYLGISPETLSRVRKAVSKKSES